ncbi:MAG: PKD domain-containing protein [Bacteroidetes bacterium]|nr:PKD domain-containing protein [Bacteroidota bacterium]
MRVKVLRCITITMVMLLCSIFCAYPQASISNLGTEFWTGYMDHVDGAGPGGSTMDLYITSNVNTSGTVSIADHSFTASFNVTANQVTIVTIPPGAFLGDAQGITSKGIHITSLKPIAIYAHIFAEAVSGATLLLPVNAMGKDYNSINYTQQSNSDDNLDEKKLSYSTFMVIATEDNTTVEITPSVTLLDGKPFGIPFRINLNKGQIYQGLANNDLTGTRIRSVSSGSSSCTKIAVFSGSSKISIGCGNPDVTSDNLFQQVYPTSAWGKNYITVPLKNRPFDIFRVVLSDPNTNVTVNGVVISRTQITNNLYYEFTSTSPNVISTDKPVQVVQYAVSQNKTLGCEIVNNGDTGDPEMIYLNPLEQTIDHVTLYSTSNYKIVFNYINVVIKTSAVPTFTLDGRPYTTFTPVVGNPQYSYAQLFVAPGPHNIKASDGFNAIAYGFGNKESYGYAAGTNLQDLNTFIVLEDPASKQVFTNGCSAQSYNLQLTLPFQPASIKWDFKDGSAPVTFSNPAPQSIVQKGSTTLYVYEYPRTVSYKAGDYSVVATVFDPLADACGSSEDVEFDFNISDAPTARFTSADNCQGDSTVFKDMSDAGANGVKAWLWDFGDGQTSIVQNPSHQYPNAGDYNVHLSINNENGCSSVYSQTIHITPKPVASFKYSAPGCAGQDVTFTDFSSSSAGTIKQWIWNFDDGAAPDTLTSNKAFTHSFQDARVYHVKLFVINDNGCSSEIYSQDITIFPLPAPNFSLPDVCTADAYAQFTDSTTMTDNSQGVFIYHWDFGDPGSGALNNSADRNPRHKYSRAANYQVTLTVTSANGCSVSKAQQFTVNGDMPKAAFTVENANNLCSSQDVVFDDNSSVDFGNITKLIWFFDYNNHPTDSVVFTKNQIPVDHKFRHNYGAFNSPLQQNYAVVLRAYSGQTCYDVTQPQTITVLANPVVSLVQAANICQGANPVQIVANTNGFTGTGVFSGPGISSAGMFNPAAAGTGVANISYTFTSASGCDYTATEQITVMPSPVITTPASFTMLEGSQVTMRASAKTDSLKYKWIPSTGLDHDDILNPVVSATEDTRYMLIATSPQGCTATAEVDVKVLKYPVIPNAFTPNGDGINDTWNIKYLDSYPNSLVEIYNRYGEKLYSSIGYPVPWDGTFKGSMVPAGTYYFIIDPKNGRKVISGSVTIIR